VDQADLALRRAAVSGGDLDRDRRAADPCEGVVDRTCPPGACRRVGQDGHSVAQVAAALGVGRATVMAAVREYGRPLVDHPDRLAGITALGVDETAFLAANATHHTMFVIGIVDVRPAHGGPPRLLDMVPGRSGTALSSWVLDQPARRRAGIRGGRAGPVPRVCDRAAHQPSPGDPGAGLLPP